MPVCLSFCVRVCLPGRPEIWDWRPAPFYCEVGFQTDSVGSSVGRTLGLNSSAVGRPFRVRL